MLPRVKPETHIDSNGDAHVRYTGVWATRPLGSTDNIPTTFSNHVGNVKDDSKPSYESAVLFLFVAVFKLCLATALTCLAIYHWASFSNPNPATTPSPFYQPQNSSLLTVTGLAALWVAGFSVWGLWPQMRNPIAKRGVVIFSIPALYLLLQQIGEISNNIAPIAYRGEQVNGFLVAEVALASLIAISIVITLYPCSDPVTPYDRKSPTGLRAVVLCLNTIVGAITLIYLCFGIYGIKDSFQGVEIRRDVTLALATTSVPINTLMLMVTFGLYYAVGWKNRSHVVPYIVVGIVALILFLSATQTYVGFLNFFMQNDWHDNAFVAMFALNCLSILGIAIVLSLGLAYAYM